MGFLFRKCVLAVAGISMVFAAADVAALAGVLAPPASIMWCVPDDRLCISYDDLLCYRYYAVATERTQEAVCKYPGVRNYLDRLIGLWEDHSVPAGFHDPAAFLTFGSPSHRLMRQFFLEIGLPNAARRSSSLLSEILQRIRNFILLSATSLCRKGGSPKQPWTSRRPRNY